jgi:hypothetical protein
MLCALVRSSELTFCPWDSAMMRVSVSLVDWKVEGV